MTARVLSKRVPLRKKMVFLFGFCFLILLFVLVILSHSEIPFSWFAGTVQKLSHQQEIWLHALEWCESRGVKTAINPKDLDGTPSYYSFQFKPETFKRYGIKYHLFPKDIADEEIKLKLSDYALQKEIVSQMINDSTVWWQREFPACVKKLGPPPDFTAD